MLNCTGCKIHVNCAKQSNLAQAKEKFEIINFYPSQANFLYKITIPNLNRS